MQSFQEFASPGAGGSVLDPPFPKQDIMAISPLDWFYVLTDAADTDIDDTTHDTTLDEEEGLPTQYTYRTNLGTCICLYTILRFAPDHSRYI